jgi:7-cyano-7-deazaguanine tRNA-ribosyltransferase
MVEMPKLERERELCRHNLYVCFSEMRRVKQAIVEGRLWEHLEMQAHSHPSLMQALKHLGKYAEYIEKHSPVTKKSGLFFYSSAGLSRPEVVRHRKRLLERCTPSEKAKVLILIPDFGSRQVRRGRRFKKALAFACKKLGVSEAKVHLCVYAPPFGVIPIELKDVYPLSQYEYASPPDRETIDYIAERIVEYIETMNYQKIAMAVEPGTWQEKAAELTKHLCAEKKKTLDQITLEN